MQRAARFALRITLLLSVCSLLCSGLLAQGNEPQQINFVPIGNVPANAAPFQVIALSSAHLPVTLTVTGPAALNGRLLTLTGTGPVTVTASQAGNAAYAPASAQLTFQSAPVTPALAWSPPSFPYGTAITPAMLNATAAAAPPTNPAAADLATITSQLNASALNSLAPAYLPGSPVFRYEGGLVTPTTDPNAPGAYNANEMPAPYGPDYRIAFTCTCKQFEFAIEARGGNTFRVWVDGAYTSPDATNDATNYPQRNYVLVQFPDKRSRQIKLTIHGDAPFFGLTPGPGDTVAAPQVPIGKRVIIFGDSWTGPTILPPLLPPAQPGLTGSGYPQTLGEYFNWDYWDDGIGGTGFTVTGQDVLERTFVQRVVTDICPNAPDAVVLLGGVNDGGATESALQAAVSTTLSELKACLPQVPVYLYGPQFSQPPLDQAFAAAVASSSALVSYTDMGLANWLYGSMTDPSTGNAYLYMGGHPTPLGHDYLAEEIAQDLLTKFPNLAPEPYPLSSPVPVPGSVAYSVTPGTILPAGENPVSLAFTPQDQATYAPATALSTLKITKATTTVGLVLSNNTSNDVPSNVPTGVSDDSGLTLQATVSPQISGTPTGQVAFFANGLLIGVVPVVHGTATLELRKGTLPAGFRLITAEYGGDANFLSSSTPKALPVATARKGRLHRGATLEHGHGAA